MCALKIKRFLDRIRDIRSSDFVNLLHTLDNDLIQKIMTKKDVVDFVFAEGADPELRQWLREHGLSPLYLRRRCRQD